MAPPLVVRPDAGPAPLTALPAPSLRSTGAGPRGCPGDAHCLSLRVSRRRMAGLLGSGPCRSQAPPEQPLRVKVVGLFRSSSFQIAKGAAEVTAQKPRAGGPAHTCWWAVGAEREVGPAAAQRLGAATWRAAFRWVRAEKGSQVGVPPAYPHTSFHINF